ncbi:MAG: Crp/Fnr family transcriptional regulator [Betaproteobacteria bacterium]
MATIQNHLIELLPRKDRQHLLAQCEMAPLELSKVLAEPGKPAPYAYFPLEGFVSLVLIVDGNPGLELGMVGREGMLGAHLALGVESAPLHALVQGEGTAWRISAAALRRELALSPALQRGLNRYLYVLMGQMAETAGCLRYHQIGPRLARWLLMSQDRAHSKSFEVTHEFLAYMLGVRRVGITNAASELKRVGLIDYQRGHMTVVDRKGLEAAACSCYAADRHTYANLLA